jgi:LacI family transcriptional regulator
MPGKHRSVRREDSLAAFACPNEDCPQFNVFAAGNLSVCERMGKQKDIRRLYCSSCGTRFSERQGTLLEYTKLPEATVVRIIKCLGHGCSIEATADICEVDPRSVELLLDKAGPRADTFHRLQLQKLRQPLEVVELDEMHGRTAPALKRGRVKLAPLAGVMAELQDVAARAAPGFIWRW